MSYRIYCKNFRWFIACSTDVPVPEKVSLPKSQGCLGIDINPGVIGWADVNSDGNLRQHGQFKVNLHSRRSGQIRATLHDLTKQIVKIAEVHKCPIVRENSDFQSKQAWITAKPEKSTKLKIAKEFTL